MIIRPAQPIATSNKPQTDRRAVFANVQNETGEIDLLIAQQTERFGQLRCIYIDTSAQDTDGNGCVIETDLGQNITALAQTQGYYPVFLPFVSKLKISSNQAVNILLLDFDMRPSIWPTALASSNVPDPLHVIIDDQPIATNAEVQNWPAVQPVSISGQPIEVSQGSVFVTQATQLGAWNVNATLQNGILPFTDYRSGFLQGTAIAYGGAQTAIRYLRGYAGSLVLSQPTSVLVINDGLGTNLFHTFIVAGTGLQFEIYCGIPVAHLPLTCSIGNWTSGGFVLDIGGT